MVMQVTGGFGTYDNSSFHHIKHQGKVIASAYYERWVGRGRGSDVYHAGLPLLNAQGEPYTAEDFAQDPKPVEAFLGASQYEAVGRSELFADVKELIGDQFPG